MTAAAAGGEIFNQDFYVAVATVVPVIWLTAGLASQATDGLLRLLDASGRWRPLLLRMRSTLMVTLLSLGFAAEAASLLALSERDAASWLRVFTLVCALDVLAQGTAIFGLALFGIRSRADRANNLQA